MKNHYNAVKKILLEFPDTRDDDMLLFARFCYHYGFATFDDGFLQFMANAKKNGVPSYESVTRARRKVQETEPYLCGKKKKARKDEEQKYREFYGRN